MAEEVSIWGWPLKTAGLLTAEHSSRSFTILTGRVAERLEEETGLQDMIVCSRSRVNGKLYPLRLALPPDNTPMRIFIVPPTSTAAKEFMPNS